MQLSDGQFSASVSKSSLIGGPWIYLETGAQEFHGIRAKKCTFSVLNSKLNDESLPSMVCEGPYSEACAARLQDQTYFLFIM